eukprot:CAMPEP_0173143184 /NCGR_PEP_ID=MMETSP1105-20130129/6527_1 /TAXON_ID=2985 /ORGANISM="Ochromonas sp., Strain BG-1" /LENGTH=454 /DNA_ID=CAMNT_0014056707 /DNA_START=131 /DNA_END=1495 /DNA_ORIENTATION=-
MTTISCNTSLHRLLFKKERIVKLFGENTITFFYDADFQQMILEKIESPLDQLFLHDESNLYNLLTEGDDLEVPQLNGIKTLILPVDIYVKLNELFPEFLPAVQNLHLCPSFHEEIESERIIPFLHRVTKSIQFSSLQNLPEELSLSSTLEELSFEYCNAIHKLSSPLPNLRTVKLTESIIENLNDFNHLQELSLDETQVSVMTNYTALNTAKRLILQNFQGLSDFTFLQETEEIFISSFFQMIDYSKCFKKSKNIALRDFSPSIKIDVDLSYYSQVEEFTITGEKLILKNGLAKGIVPAPLKRLNLANVFGIANLTGFEHLMKISLLNCPDITTLEGLTRVPSIHLYGLGLTSLEGLGENRDVWIESCGSITDFSPLKSVNRVKIVNCKGFTEASHLDHVAYVVIDCCGRLEDVRDLRNAKSVRLSNCPFIKSIEGLKDVKDLKVSNCKFLLNL